MKKLINKKTGEIAYIDLYFNTITFSKSKTTHKISIQKDPNTNQITKITSSPDSIPNPNPIPEPISELTPEPITNNISSKPSNASTPISDTPVQNNSDTPNNTPINNTNTPQPSTSTNSNPNKTIITPNHKQKRPAVPTSTSVRTLSSKTMLNLLLSQRLHTPKKAKVVLIITTLHKFLEKNIGLVDTHKPDSEKKHLESLNFFKTLRC